MFQPCKQTEIPATLKLLSRQHPGIFAGGNVTAEFAEEDRPANGYNLIEAIDLAKAGYVKPEAPVAP